MPSPKSQIRPDLPKAEIKPTNPGQTASHYEGRVSQDNRRSGGQSVNRRSNYQYRQYQQKNEYQHTGFKKTQFMEDESRMEEFDKSKEGTIELKCDNKKYMGRCRLFIGNIPNDMSDAELKELCAKSGSVGEVFVNNQRGFAFVRFDNRITAEQAKFDMDGIVIRGKTLRVRFASHGAAVRVRNLSDYVSNELLAEGFSYFGRVERAVVAVDDRGKSTGEGIVEFDRKPVALQCITKCSEGCFLLTSELKPVIVESLVQVDEEDGLMERTLTKSENYCKARSQNPRFVHPGSFEHSICVRWMDLEEQRKSMEAQLKDRIQLAREQLELEIEQISIDHQAYMMREDLVRRQNELHYIEEKRRQDLEKRKSMIQLVLQQQQSNQQSSQFNFPRYSSGQGHGNMRMMHPMHGMLDNSGGHQMHGGGPPSSTQYASLSNYLNNQSGTSQLSPSVSSSSGMNNPTNLITAASLSALNNRIIPPGLFSSTPFFQNAGGANDTLPSGSAQRDNKSSKDTTSNTPSGREQQISSNNGNSGRPGLLDDRPFGQRKRSRF